MEIQKIIDKIKKHEKSRNMGMIASHLGIVRGYSRNGRDVEGVAVRFDMDVLNDIMRNIKDMPGVVEVIVEVNEGRLKVGDELMFVAVGGDIRENVFHALIEAVNQIKNSSSSKQEIFVS